MKIFILLIALSPSLVHAKLASDLEINRAIAKTVAEQLNSIDSVESLIQKSQVTAELKHELIKKLAATIRSEKLNFTSKDDQVIIQSGTDKVVIKIINSLQEKYSINNYDIDLFGKTENEKYLYILKVLSRTNSSKSARSLFSLLLPSAYAEDKNRWLDDSDLKKLGIASTQVFSETKIQSCDTYKKILADKSSYFGGLKNITAYARSDASLTQKNASISELAAKVAVSFWCNNHTTSSGEAISSFSVKCDKKEIKSVAYRSFSKTDSDNNSIGFIRETPGEGLFKWIGGGTSAATLTERRFKDGDFKKNIEKCCENSICTSQMNSIAPIGDPDRNPNILHDKINQNVNSKSNGAQ